MGDMKTPDFDDLLAAFDIPDIDANEAIHSGPEENEGPGDSGKPEPSVGGESGEATAAAAQDGSEIPAQASDHGLPPPDISAVSVIVKNTVCPEQPESPAGSSGGDGTRAVGVTKEGPVGHRLMQNGFGGPESSLPGTPHSPAPPSGGTWKEKAMEGKAPLDLFAHFGPEPGEHPDPLPPAAPSPPQEGAMTPPPFSSPFELSRENGPALLSSGSPPPLGTLKQDSCSPIHPPGLAGLGSGSSPEAMDIPAGASPPQVTGVPFFKQSPGHQSPPASPRVPRCQPLKEEEEEGPVAKSSPRSPQSPSSGAEAADEDSNDSPASSSSSRPLKVRIKTIKTSCGNITRTVTRVPSDPEPPAPLAEGTLLAEAGLLKLSPAPPTPEGPKVVSVQLGDGTRLKGTVLPVATIQNASTAMLMAASVARKAVVLPGGAATSPKTMAKNVLGLVPQTLPKAEGRVGLGAGGQKVNGASVVMVQPSKPAPGPGAGGGTVISRTQSSLVEAFNKVLNSKNLLPAYRPNLSPPAEAGLALPPTGYRCLECGDAFSLEKSLARHYDRRSMRIEVTCNHCARRLVFFNKCSLLLHAREHKDKGLVMQCSHLVMRPVALDQMVGQPDITPLLAVPPALGPPALPALGKGDGAITAAITAVPAEAPVLPLSSEPPAAPATSAYTCFRCLECKEQCRDKAGMAAHFQQLGPPAPGANSTVCPTCPMMLPNRCSFSAHQRMHKNRPPHVCPECGGNFLQANFQTHLREACLHLSRRVGYRCPSCAVVFGGVNSIKSHIQTSHCEVFHKCPICPMAFKSAPSAHAHLYTQHPSFHAQQAKMIYKCAMCDTVFTHKPLLSSHFDQHLLPQRVSVFKCPSCPLLFAQKRTMLDHLKNTHQSGRQGEDAAGKGAAGALTTPKAEPEELAVSRGGTTVPTEESSSSSEEEELPSSPSPPRPTKRPRRELGSKGIKGGGGGGPGGWTCGLCHSWFPERDEYVAHMKKEHGKSVKKFPCRLCERSFCSAPSLRRHVRVNHEGIKRVYPCRYCTEGKRTFSSRLILEKHVQVRHGLPLGSQSPGRGSTLARGPGSRAQGPGRKRRQSSDSCSEEPDSTTPPAKSPRGGPSSGGHGPLRYRSGGSVEQSLMVGLRVDGGAQQCLDCGLCFASPGSLSRHRFISHKKKRGVGGASALGLGDGEEVPPPLRSDPEGGESPLPASGGPLTCKVCGKSCDSPLNLKTHFRTHGMAFIRARQGGSGDN
ncbi:zinc finger protein 687 [Felis catus]|uniref:C2H2-type domain-containing protein n=1 Tax=Felis catus TaxID=9685 RepID=A0ABI7Z391_FELCA|nr:zinc finger protein 687 [Felis catus]XP_006935181.2 zinc finger protein 687 [Felis catus]XP_019693388.2 zinc finger protein 687 [Felis catus]XP_019693389.2 zinc finger protein 687 [Felis catus]XP_019693390.2 zinc finger protein 687 [Felis catus]XP_044889442.1 zinc finger protein 687 [Felis catus]XP_044889443.1 zinc finger protein 687 [Felis catus]